MNVICYGDSNTYGYDAQSQFGGRFDADCRWVDILANKTGWNIYNEGINGQEIPSSQISVPDDTHLLIVMLGSNDLLQGNCVSEITKRMERFLSGLELESSRILLIAPPSMCRGEWVTNQELISASKELAKQYRALAMRLGVRFADAGKWDIPITYDGVHFTKAGHKIFAERLYELLYEKG